MRSLRPWGRKQERSPALIPRKGWVASSCAVLTHLRNFPTNSLFAQRERTTAAAARLCAHMSEQAQAPLPNSRQLRTSSSEHTSPNLAKSTGCCALHRQVLQHPKCIKDFVSADSPPARSRSRSDLSQGRVRNSRDDNQGFPRELSPYYLMPTFLIVCDRSGVKSKHWPNSSNGYKEI